MYKVICALAGAACLAFAQWAAASTELQLWHAMQGAPAEALQKLADRFNALQQTYKVVPLYQGNYQETFNAGLAAARQGKAPHLLQVYEVGTADMMAERNIYKPLYQLAAETHLPLDKEAWFPPAAAFYSDPPGRLLAMPFNSSTPVLYYNRDAFIKAGLDPDKPPVSWYELQPMLIALRNADIECPYITSWQAWVHVENVSAWHNYPVASANNGFGPGRPELLFNSHLMIRHISLLSAWMKSELFIYSGRHDEGEARFASGECAVFSGSSAALAGIAANARFGVGVAQLPHYDDFKGAPYNTLLGGAALWVMAGKSAVENTGTARFLQYLATPEAAIEWHKSTGYVAPTRGAYTALRKSGYYEVQPQMEIAVNQLRGIHTGTYARGVRLRHFDKIRDILDEELEQVWKGNKPPKQALDDAVARGNVLLGAPSAAPIPAAKKAAARSAPKAASRSEARPAPKPASKPAAPKPAASKPAAKSG